jgi:hypothetical protein
MTTTRNLTSRIVLTVGALLTASSTGMAAWQPHEIRQQNGKDPQIRLPAQFQIVTESWHRVVAVPYITYMPEKDRLLMVVSCDYPHRAFILTSDDRGANWTAPRPASVNKEGKPSVAMATSLAYFGNGKALFYADHLRWFSRDSGATWGDTVPILPTSDGKRWSTWDPPLVDRDQKTGKFIRLAETGYTQTGTNSQAYIRFSTDEGQSWSKSIKVPQWHHVNEVALFRAGNGDLVAGCRTDVPDRIKETLDHYEGLGVSVSKDDGHTWSTVNKLYDYGRHHPSLLLMPNQDIVMTYVVRLGYVASKEGFPQFGVEAIVSHDHGRSWDLDHKTILHAWPGDRNGENSWWPSSQATSSKLLPDGSIITAFGTGYRIGEEQGPRDVGLVRWRPSTEPVNTDTTIRDAAVDSNLRNVFDPLL